MAFSLPDSFRVDRLTRRENLAFSARWITILLSVICVGLIASTASTLITTRLTAAKLVNKLESFHPVIGPLSSETSAPDISSLTSKSIFGSLVLATSPTTTGPVATVKDPLVLIGTFVTGGEPPYAIIEDDKKKVQDVFGLGESVFGDGTVKRILVDRVEIERGGQIETLMLDDDTGASDDGMPNSGGGDLVVVQEAEYTQALDNLPLLLTQARAVPYFKDGKAQGLRLFAVKAGSFYERLGLKNGDVLKSINENSLADLSQAMQLLEKLKTERSFSISVDRNSEARVLRYEIR